MKTVPKDDSGLSVSKAVHGSPLTIPCKFLRSLELSLRSFLVKIKNAIAGFATPPPHHKHPSLTHQLLPALFTVEFVFVQEDASVPSLTPLYCGPYLVLEQRDKYFCLQLGSRTDVISQDRLKPAFSEDPISAALSPVHGRPALCALDPPPSTPSATFHTLSFVRKGMCFKLLPPVPAWLDPCRIVHDRSTISAMPSRGESCGRLMSYTLFQSFKAPTDPLLGPAALDYFYIMPM